MRALVRFFLSPEAAVFLPASFFSGALEAVAGALEAGFLSAALGGILVMLIENVGESGQAGVQMQMDGESKDVGVGSKWVVRWDVDEMGE